MALINATLVVQAIHFYIAFLMIKHLFFKPLFAQIEQENSLQESLISTVQKQQMRVAEKEQALKDQWQQLKAYFAREAPAIHAPLFSEAEHAPIKIPGIPSDQIKKVISQTAQSIVQKVEHVG